MLAYIYRELYIIDDLRAKILIRNDILGPKNIVINISNKTAKIGSYNYTATITARLRG